MAQRRSKWANPVGLRTRPQSERSLVVKQGQKTRHELKGGWKSKVQFGGASDSIDSMTVVSGYVSSVQNWFKRKAARGCFSAMAVFLPFHPSQPWLSQPDATTNPMPRSHRSGAAVPPVGHGRKRSTGGLPLQPKSRFRLLQGGTVILQKKGDEG